MSYKKYYSPSRVESDHKDLIISQLKAEIADLQHREREYHEALEQLNILEGKIEALGQERAEIEARRRRVSDENESEIISLKDQIARAKRNGQDRDNELDGLLQEKKRLEAILGEKRINISKLRREIDDLKYRNATIDEKVKALRNQVQRREEENKELDARLRELHRQLDKISEENRMMEHEIAGIEGEINDLRVKIEHMEQDKLNANAEYDECKARNAENARVISQLENQLFGLERDLKHFVNMNENYKSEIVSCEKSYQDQLKKNMDLTRDLQGLEAEHNSKLGEAEEIRRDLEKVTIMFNEVNEDNGQLEMDIERYKENVRALSCQNEELIIELDKISEQDENVRYILNRKGRIESLIAKAEAQVLRNQIVNIAYTKTEIRTASPIRR